MCDVTLAAGDYSIQAHKVVLAANSDYFCAMFSGNWTEKQKDNVTLHELTPLGLKAVIEFSYHGTLTVDMVDIENIGEIVSAIHHCQLVKAYKPCEDFLKEEINSLNFFTLLELSNLFSLEKLQNDLFKFFVQELAPSYLDDDTDSCLDGLETSHLKDFLEKWDFTLYGFGQISAFDFVFKWTKKNDRAGDLQDLLSAVNRTGGDVTKAVRYCQLKRQDRALEVKSTGPILVSCGYDNYANDPKQTFLVIVYNVETNTWKKLPIPSCLCPSCPAQVADDLTFGAAVLDGVFYVCGGHHGDSRARIEAGASSICHKYDPYQDRWVAIQSMKRTRTCFPLLAFDGKLYALGGLVGSTPTDTVEVYDPATDQWTDGFLLPKALHDHAAVGHGGKIYISGGREEENGLEVSYLYCCDPHENSWTEKKPMLCARFHHGLVAHGDYLYQFFGRVFDSHIGMNGELVSDWLWVSHSEEVEVYNVSTDTWAKLEVLINSKMYKFLGSCSVGNFLYIFCELSGIDETLAVFKYDPEKNSFTKCFEVDNRYIDDGAVIFSPLDFPSVVYDCICHGAFEPVDEEDSEENS
jgi:hypothetical protein